VRLARPTDYLRRVDRERIQRTVLRLPVLRRLHVRRWIWDRRNDLARARRELFERCGSDRFSHPSLHGLDRALAELLPARPGFFVEAGAYDGFIQSNTYWLERFRGWRGVLIEPVPHLFDRARRQRPNATVVNCALVPADYPEATVTLRYGGLMSTVCGARGAGADEESHVSAGDMFGLDDVGHEVSVPARTLTSVLEEARAPSEFELLSLDVEGFEASVLHGLDLDRFAPRVLLVEMHDVDAQRPAMEEILGDRYEFGSLLSPLDAMYRRRDAAARS
jgi:FkbM family methyltransferase